VASSGKSHLFLAPLDRSSPPREIPGVEGDQPVFGPKGEILFRRVEGATHFLYGIHPDGTGMRKLAAVPIVGLSGLTPDRKWVSAGVPFEMGVTALAIPIDCGEPFRIPKFMHKWSGDGKYWFWADNSNTHIIPLRPGEVWARNAEGVVPSVEEEAAKLPGARVIPSLDAAPGPTGDIYAFTNTTVQRNLYRIPVP
jgi:hypothetical protein